MYKTNEIKHHDRRDWSFAMILLPMLGEVEEVVIANMVFVDQTFNLRSEWKLYQSLRRRDVQIGERTFEVVPEFTYLGSKVSNDNSMEAELLARMLAANRSFYSLKNQFTSKNLSRRTKLGLYSTYIVPVLTYASEIWTLSKSDETLLVAFERKMFRRILGPVCVEGQWRSPYNDELYEMYGDLTVVQRIKLARLRWADHVVRMEMDGPAHKVFLGRPQRQRRRGRPKLRW